MLIFIRNFRNSNSCILIRAADMMQFVFERYGRVRYFDPRRLKEELARKEDDCANRRTA